jgi:hypothetical protein
MGHGAWPDGLLIKPAAGGPGRCRQLGRRISSKARHSGGQWQSRVSRRCRHAAWQRSPRTAQQDSQWQVSDRRYLSEGSMALLTKPKEVVTRELIGA